MSTIDSIKKLLQQSITTLQERYSAFFKQLNNWNLVDVPVPLIIGVHLFKRDRALLFKLAQSKIMRERRIAIVSTLSKRKHYLLRCSI